MSDASVRVVPVEILGQRFPIKSALDESYVAELASYVDAKIRSASEATPTRDTVGVAVLAALNIADEYFRCRDLQGDWQRLLDERAGRVERLLDDALLVP
jgi:cell division protein ZapA